MMFRRRPKIQRITVRERGSDPIGPRLAALIGWSHHFLENEVPGTGVSCVISRAPTYTKNETCDGLFLDTEELKKARPPKPWDCVDENEILAEAMKCIGDLVLR